MLIPPDRKEQLSEVLINPLCCNSLPFFTRLINWVKKFKQASKLKWQFFFQVFVHTNQKDDHASAVVYSILAPNNHVFAYTS